MFDKTIKEYGLLARHYDQRWSSYVGCSTRETLRRLPLDAGQAARLLDVGCGTGVLLDAIRNHFPLVEVVGIDPSRAMLAVARQRLPERAQLLEARAERLPVPDEQFDVLVSCSAFHYFENPRQALSEMKRALRQGGRLVVTDWCDDFICCKLCALFLRATRRPYHKLYGTGECVRLLRETGFQNIVADRYRIGFLWGLMTIRARR